MTEIVKGLFGFSPQELAMQRDQELTTKANAFAQLSPEQRATQMLYKGGNQLAGAVGGMLGAQDPQMKKSSDLQGILQGGDLNSVEGLKAMGDKAAALGYGTEAQQMYAKAQEVAQSQAVTRKATAEAAGSENKLKLDEQFRKEFSALPADATVEQQMAVINKYGGIDAVGKNVQLASDKAAQRELDKTTKAERLQFDKEKAAQLSEDRRRHDSLMASIAQGNQALRGATQGLQQQAIQARLDKDKRELQDSTNNKIISLDQTLTTLNDIENHPGKADVVGTLTGGARKLIPGTDAAGFASKIDTFKAQVFLPMVQQLKGMGALSDAEGKKLSDAVGTLNTNMKLDEFNASVTRIKAELNAAREKAQQRLNGGLVSTTPSSSGSKEDPLGIRK
jgi:hypothetical protein